MNSSSSHISAEILADLAEERQTSEADLAHLSTCSTCCTARMQLREVIRLMRSDQSEIAPRDVLAAAIDIFASVSRPMLHQVIARLTFDGLTATPAFVRSGQTTARQLIYSAPATDIDLRVTVENEKRVVAGQILSDKCVPGQVTMSGST